MRLLEPSDMPQVQGLDVPASFYLVTRDPAPLAGMVYPRWAAPTWRALSDLGLTRVLSLTNLGRAYDPSPLGPPVCIEMEDLGKGELPRDPAPEAKKVSIAVAQALAWLRAGEGVIVHCEGGTGRTGTVLGCVLGGLGFEVEEVVDYLDRVTKARGRPGWPESAWQAEIVRGTKP